MKTELLSGSHHASDEPAQSATPDAEVDDMDIPLLLETVESSATDRPPAVDQEVPDENAGDEDADDLVPMLMLDDALIEDGRVDHMAPLSDPLDEDKRLQPGREAITPEEMLDLQAAVAASGGAIAAPGAVLAAKGPVSALNLASATLLESTRAMAEPHVNGAAEPVKKGENPFLPQHILDKLHQGRRNLVEDIAQSTAALDASSALFRSRTRPHRFVRIAALGQLTPAPTEARDKIHDQRDKLIDELVEEFLPLVAAELRRRLKRMLND